MQNKPVALVTGANKGIGLQIAKDLAAHGFTVLIGSCNLEHGETAAKSVGADASVLQLDVTNQPSIAAAAERIRNEVGRLDVLVNNAGVSQAGKPGRPLQEIAKSGRASVASLNFQDTRTVQQAAREPVRLALLDANGPTGTFSNEDGLLPW
jgi:NAD(P)-dependent dehydrogenase (short-subunit alcohol dehydrogenase family)